MLPNLYFVERLLKFIRLSPFSPVLPIIIMRGDDSHMLINALSS